MPPLAYGLPGGNHSIPLGLPPLANFASSKEIVQLGRRLFVDTNFSADGKISCAKCHVPKLAFADGSARSAGQGGRKGTRNAPSLVNVAYSTSLFWDGRSPDLESQARAPLLNPVEHSLDSDESIAEIIRRDASYRREFSMAFHVDPNHIESRLVARALAAYERTMLAGGSPFDQYFYGHAKCAMNDAAVRGLHLFRGRAKCASCHLIGATSALLSDGEYHESPGGLPKTANEHLPVLVKKVADAMAMKDRSHLERLIATDAAVASLGRFAVTLDPRDIGKFKTPSLRNVAVTKPYMHDGSVGSLVDAVDQELYGRAVSERRPIVLTAEERFDLVEFLRALTSPEFESSQATKNTGSCSVTSSGRQQ